MPRINKGTGRQKTPDDKEGGYLGDLGIDYN